jgi:hypothetical protein
MMRRRERSDRLGRGNYLAPPARAAGQTLVRPLLQPEGVFINVHYLDDPCSGESGAFARIGWIQVRLRGALPGRWRAFEPIHRACIAALIDGIKEPDLRPCLV